MSDPRRLKPGDVVRLSAEPGDWVVRGTLAFDEDGYRWKEHLLDGSTADGERRHWLSVEEGESGLELVLWDRLPGSDLTPDAREVAHRRRRLPPRRARPGALRLHRHDGRGRVRHGRVRRLPAGRAAATPGCRSSGTAASGSWEVSTGRVVLAESLTILHS